jgi:hypothetical protein
MRTNDYLFSIPNDQKGVILSILGNNYIVDAKPKEWRKWPNKHRNIAILRLRNFSDL